MGWCQAFGPQIRDGCDHAMVAGSDSCSCDQCGVVCYGMFPGCASVWAAGPRPAITTKPGKEAGGLVPVIEVGAPAERSHAAASELHALRVDLQTLMWKFDQLQLATPAGEELMQAAQDIRAVARGLPQQVQEAVAEAVAVALAAQRKAARQMFGQIELEIRADIGQLRETLLLELQRPALPPATPAVSVADLDTRFQWLVEAVSERFITLGNGLARIERQMAAETAEPSSGTGTNGMGGSGANGSTASGTANGATTNGAGANGAPPAPRATWGAASTVAGSSPAGPAGDKARP